MAHTETWDATFESKPADGDQVAEGADRIRDLKLAVRERFAIDHYMAIAGTDADHGQHVKLTLRVGAAPTHVADKAIIYAKDYNDGTHTYARPYYIDEGGTEFRFEAFATGTKMLFYQDTAPLGWTIQNTLDDKLVYITKGSAASGQTGGGVHSTGTWTQTGHTHDVGSIVIPSHYHLMKIGGRTSATTVTGKASSDLDSSTFTADSASAWGGVSETHYKMRTESTPSATACTGTTASGAEAATWRPAAYCCIICAKA